MYKEIDHLCFDKDGVLIDVHAYWRHTTEIRADYLMDKLQFNSIQKNMLIESMGINLLTGKIKNSGPVGYKPRKSIIAKVKETLSHLSIKVGEIENYFLEVDRYQQEKGDFKFKLLDGVIEFLEDKANSYIMTIFTSDRKKNTILALQKFGIENYFKIIIGGDSVKESKPNPEGILKACSQINIGPENTGYISDTYSDLLMAENAKLPCKVGLLTGLGSKKELNKKGDFICKDFFELANYL